MPQDFQGAADTLQPIVAAGETYALPRTWTIAEVMDYWCMATHSVFIAESDGRPVGTYFLQSNQLGGGSHIANCGFATHPAASGRGVARAMCAHALIEARDRGYTAMQFNFVVSTNTRAIALWTALGFDIVGTIPAAFDHPTHGYVAAHIMHRRLSSL